jgi:hypothetical protein
VNHKILLGSRAQVAKFGGKFLMIRLFLLLSLVVFVPKASCKPIDTLLSGDRLWTQKPEEFFTAASKLGYEWTSSAQDSARVARKDLTAYGLPAVESIARFKDGKLSEITIMFYARGDAGDLAKDKFDALVRTAAETLNKATNTKFTPRGKDPTNAVKADGLIWQTETAHYLLEFSFTKEVKSRDIPFRAEFVRLEITPPDKNGGQPASAKNAASGKFSGAEHVKRDAASGDVWLGDVPMVDQGQKGYCVVAATERVMRYYGVSVDQQELAQAANTSSEGGTSGDAMLDALKKLSARFKVRVREVEKSDIKQLLALITDYNRAAKRAAASPIPEQGNMIDVGEVYRAMDVNILREVRTKNKSDLNRFQRAVQAHIDAGTPLLWTVMLGKVPEPDIPQNAGGHMRLIIGYNTKKEEILFSDSWGAGHELKRMPAADAWTITTGTMSIEPF